jgi:hypothetical protein
MFFPGVHLSRNKRRRQECRRGTQECVRHALQLAVYVDYGSASNFSGQNLFAELEYVREGLDLDHAVEQAGRQIASEARPDLTAALVGHAH